MVETNKKVYMRWDDEKNNVLHDNYKKMTAKMMADLLGSSEKAIKTQLSRLRLLKSKEEIKAILCSQSRDMSGENNPNYKGGISKEKYRYKKIQKQRNGTKINCRQKTQRAIKKGEIIKTACLYCGDSNVVTHHLSYDDYKNVIFVCRNCHRYKCHDGKH